MQLVQAGRIDLDAPVGRYLPWFRVADGDAGERISVRHLLHQTSGLPAQAGESPLADFDSRPDAAERQARALAAIRLAHPPGAAFEYCNANYTLLGLVIEAAGGKPYAEYVQAHIFAPLGMDHSYTTQAAARRNGLAVGHRYWFGFPVAAPDLPIPPGSLAAGEIISCAGDMARYLVAWLNRGRCRGAQILSGADVDEMLRGAVEYRTLGIEVGKYGMWWFDSGSGAARTVWHSGTDPDFSSYMGILPHQQKGIVLLFNATIT